MIGNPKWFNQRKYTGWGLTPNCWQGWAYIAAIATPVALINLLPITGQFKTGFMAVWALLFIVDFIDLMRKVKRDERDTIHEAIAERNAMWFMISALAIGAAYEAARGLIVNNAFYVDPVILIALGGAVITKAITHFYLRNK